MLTVVALGKTVPGPRFHVKNGVRRLVIAALLFAAAGVAAQPSVRVTGVVRDPSGAAIAGASVALRVAHFSSSINTDSDGHFAAGAGIRSVPALLEPGF